MRQRSLRAELAITLLILGAATSCVMGMLPPTGSGAAVRVPVFLLAFLVSPGLLWSRRWPSERCEGLEAIGRVFVLGALHDLVVMIALAGLGVGLRSGLLAWCFTLLLPLVRGKKGSGASPQRTARRGAWAGTMAFAALGTALACWMGVTAERPSLHNDGPAHQGAIVDAIHSDAWLPPDRSFRANASEVDPRFGLGHGLYAAASVATSSDPADVLRYAPVAVAPLGLLAHAWLFSQFGLPPPAALAAGVVFTISGTGGRGFGLWASGYPGNLSLVLATLGLAFWLTTQLRAPEQRRHMREGWMGPALVALTVPVHPFAWWAFLLLVAHAWVLFLIHAAHREAARGLLVSMLGCLALGALLLVPRWLDRAQVGPTHHQIVLDALLLGDRFFVADPLAVLRWASRTALWVVPVALLVLDRWRDSRRGLIALAGAVVVWTVSLDPLVEPLAWKLVAYLSVRLGRLSYAPAVWLLTLGFAWSAMRRRRTGLLRASALLPLVLAGWFFAREARSSVEVARRGPPPRNEPVWVELEGLAEALDRLPPGSPLADPRTSYGLRALRGGASVLTPRAHSSPRDTELLVRLGIYRGILDPLAPLDSIQADLRELDADYLVVNEAVERSYRGEEYGFVPSDGAQRELAGRLEALGAGAVAVGRSWHVYRVPDLLGLREGVEPLGPPVSEPDPAFVLEKPVEASRFAVTGLRLLEPEGAVGGDLTFRVWYRAHAGENRTRHPAWERLHLRLEGPLPVVPAWAEPVDKLYRKFLIERRGRSSSRFGFSWVPFDGSRPPRRWGDGLVSEVRRVRIPEYIPPGRYTLQLTVHEPIWRGNRVLRDYLSDDDSYSSDVLGSIPIVIRASAN